jgi:serine/threonine protein kinase
MFCISGRNCSPHTTPKYTLIVSYLGLNFGLTLTLKYTNLDIVYMIVKLEKGGDLFTYIKKNEKLSESESISILFKI